MGVALPLFSLNADKATTVVGYTSKEYMNKSEVTAFTSKPQDDRLTTSIWYIQEYYRYIYRITIPHGYSLVLPEEFDSTWATGMKPSNQRVRGYEKEGPLSTGPNGDTYNLVTIIREISYDASGKALGFTSYLPFSVGRNPSTDLIFKYVTVGIDWSSLSHKK